MEVLLNSDNLVGQSYPSYPSYVVLVIQTCRCVPSILFLIARRFFFNLRSIAIVLSGRQIHEICQVLITGM
jgi:hypothetical protein